MKPLQLATLLCLLIACSKLAAANTEKTYREGDFVPSYVNNIGPYANPSELYPYYTLPFCVPEHIKIENRNTPLGEVLEGDAISNSLYQIQFKAHVASKTICTRSLTGDEVDKFIDAIDRYYYFEFFLDSLPLRGFIGTSEHVGGSVRRYLFKHLHFEVMYNGNHVIYANVTSDLDRVVELFPGKEATVDFSYSVHWAPTSHPYATRMELFQDHFFKQEVEILWLSIMNSLALVILLTGFIAVIIMRLKSDYLRYSRVDEEEDDDDYGWKLVHGDIFRFPKQLNIFCALLGLGAQFLAMALCILILALMGLFYPGDHGHMYTTAVILYALTSGIAGWTSATFFKKFGGEKWAWNLVVVSLLFAAPTVGVATVLNAIAHHHQTTSYVPLGTTVEVFAIWLFVGFPLTVVGGIAGRRTAAPFSAPTRTKNFPREIPHIPWYRREAVQVIMSGFLPFSAIYIELYYVYSSVWGHHSYTLYGILFLVFIILLIVTACITIAQTYFQLSMEDHRWWWRAFFSGGSTGFFCYAYAAFYFFFRSNMSGLLQAAFFFGYMAIFCYCLFIMLGFVGFIASLAFVKQIYSNIKCD